MEKEKNTPILEQIIKRLEEIQEAEIISRKIAKILFQLILAATLYLLGLFIYWVKIASSMNSNEFIHAYKLPLISLTIAVSIGINQNISRYRQKKKVTKISCIWNQNHNRDEEGPGSPHISWWRKFWR